MGCGGGSDDPAAPRSARVEIAEFKYAPVTVRVAAGGSITFVNRDRVSHTATTSDGAPARFDTGRLKRGGSRAISVWKPGRYDYICAFHPYMKGVVEVAGG